MQTPTGPATAASHAELTDEELARRVVDGEVELFELLVRRHNGKVYRAVRGLIRDEAAVEDLMQQAYVRAYTHLAQFNGASKLSTWLVRIAINEALQRLRADRGLKLLDVESASPGEDPMASPQESPEDSTHHRALLRVVEAAIDELPEIYRTTLMLRDVQGFSTAEASEALQVEEDAVKQRLHRARAMLREGLQARLGPQLADAFGFQAVRCDRIAHGVMEKLRALTRR